MNNNLPSQLDKTKPLSCTKLAVSILPAKPALALLVTSNGPKKVDFPKGRPIGIAKIIFAVSTLPKHEAREAHLAAGANDQVGVRTIVRIEKTVQSVGRKTLENLFGRISTCKTLLKIAFYSFDDFLTTTVSDS